MEYVGEKLIITKELSMVLRAVGTHQNYLASEVSEGFFSGLDAGSCLIPFSTIPQLPLKTTALITIPTVMSIINPHGFP